LKLKGLEDKVGVITLKPDAHYWPIRVLALNKEKKKWEQEKIN